ncbi:gastrin/cholecystokinin type B receptor-like isoform X2 [Pomacea canaliculata]|uniref:gastrin/cholecystokinin type B receptor-like isoform X2 n=1 Tax=Pomacea canaliculata TaxID=400727 RepID=UPI000D73F588|nr:gastrin/cholecystokinin type B receptor-like isoform X2 [Pomacea canaliculata]XP_025085345.1 gastrin/cholecystokinin type B receptor-like isoform X2 [Pomacea canaliculata]
MAASHLPSATPTTSTTSHTAVSSSDIVLLVAFLAVGVVALCANVVVLLTLALTRKLRMRSSSAFVLSLAVADTAFTVLTVSLATCGLLSHQWLFSKMMCRLTASVITFFSVGSAMSVAAIALDRYLAILHCLRYSTWPRWRYVGFVLLAIWVQALLFGVTVTTDAVQVGFVLVQHICDVQPAPSMGYLWVKAIVTFPRAGQRADLRLRSHRVGGAPSLAQDRRRLAPLAPGLRGLATTGSQHQRGGGGRRHVLRASPVGPEPALPDGGWQAAVPRQRRPGASGCHLPERCCRCFSAGRYPPAAEHAVHLFQARPAHRRFLRLLRMPRMRRVVRSGGCTTCRWRAPGPRQTFPRSRGGWRIQLELRHDQPAIPRRHGLQLRDRAGHRGDGVAVAAVAEQHAEPFPLRHHEPALPILRLQPLLPTIGRRRPLQRADQR